MRILAMTAALMLSVGGLAGIVGCDDTLESEKKVEVKDDGTKVTREERTVEKPDGAIEKTEEKTVEKQGETVEKREETTVNKPE